MRNDEQNNIKFENERVSRLLGGLKRVEAPGDFDFRVKARIAAGRPVDRSASWLQVGLRLAVPLGLLLLVGGYFGFNTLYSSNAADAPIAEVQPRVTVPVSNLQPNAVAPVPANENEVLAERTEVKAPDTVDKISPVLAEKRNPASGTSIKQPDGGSTDSTFGIAHGPKTIVQPKEFGRPAFIPATDVLSQIGVSARYSGSSWTIGTVKANSMADHSGLKPGDVIEALDEKNLSEKTTFGNNFSGKSIRVRRDGKSMQIALKP